MSIASSIPPRVVHEALVLAAGNGDRFQNSSRQSKLLQPILGRPLILRTLETARAAGITAFEIVVGYQADALRAAIERYAPPGIDIRFSLNPDWHLENGVSVLAARHRFGRSRFAVLMGDHLFEPPVLARLLRSRVGRDESVLAIDSRPVLPDLAAEATKVKTRGARIVAIGKELTDYDALDTGLFVCAPTIFTALDESTADGDTTLSGGIRRLAACGLMRAIDAGDAAWYDIDTAADLHTAESLLAHPPNPDSRRPTEPARGRTASAALDNAAGHSARARSAAASREAKHA